MRQVIGDHRHQVTEPSPVNGASVRKHFTIKSLRVRPADAVVAAYAGWA